MANIPRVTGLTEKIRREVLKEKLGREPTEKDYGNRDLMNSIGTEVYNRLKEERPDIKDVVGIDTPKPASESKP